MRRAASIESNRSGKPGRYFRILNWASLERSSSETWGRLCDWVTPRSASRNATGLEVIEEPRSGEGASTVDLFARVLGEVDTDLSVGPCEGGFQQVGDSRGMQARTTARLP